MQQARNGIARIAAAAVGAAILSGAVVVSTAVVADRLKTGLAAGTERTHITQSHQIDRTNKGDALNVKRDAPSAMLPGCESAFSLPSPESLTRTPSRCLTETRPLADRKFVALH